MYMYIYMYMYMYMYTHRHLHIYRLYADDIWRRCYTWKLSIKRGDLGEKRTDWTAPQELESLADAALGHMDAELDDKYQCLGMPDLSGQNFKWLGNLVGFVFLVISVFSVDISKNISYPIYPEFTVAFCQLSTLTLLLSPCDFVLRLPAVAEAMLCLDEWPAGMAPSGIVK